MDEITYILFGVFPKLTAGKLVIIPIKMVVALMLKCAGPGLSWLERQSQLQCQLFDLK